MDAGRQVPAGQDVRYAFDKKYGYKPEWGANNAYMQFAIWARMVSEAGSFYPPDVIKQYEKGEKFQSTVGEVHFRPEDHQLVRPVIIVKGKAPKAMKNKEDYWEVTRGRAGRAADAEAGRVRLQARRLRLIAARHFRLSCGSGPFMRHARLHAGHPRLLNMGKAWMAGTSPAMTNGDGIVWSTGRISFRNASTGWCWARCWR